LLVAVGHGYGDDVLSVKLTDWNRKAAIHLVEDSVGSDRGEGWGKQKLRCGRVVVCLAAAVVVLTVVVLAVVVVVVIVIVVIVVVLAIVVLTIVIVVVVVVVVVLSVVVLAVVVLAVVVLAVVVLTVVVLAIGVVIRLASEFLATKLTLRSTRIDQDPSLSNAEADVRVCISTHVLGNGLESDGVDCWVLEDVVLRFSTKWLTW
jgi:hypothetical protein